MSELAWVWEIPTGRMFRPDGTLLGSGYAGGNCGAVPLSVNNLDYVSVRFTGPIPPGAYTIKEWIDDWHGTGPMSAVLVPDADNEMYGRDGFRVHGDLIDAATKPRSASDGCPILGPAERQEMKDSPVQRLLAVPFFQPTT